MSSDDVYVYEAIDVEPPISEAELAAKIASGEYIKVTWEDPRLGDGYFAKVGETGTIGVAVISVRGDGGAPLNQGIAIQANPVDEGHRDSSLEDQLRKIITDFAIAPGGVKRMFDRALCIEKPEGEERLVVRDGSPTRISGKV